LSGQSLEERLVERVQIRSWVWLVSLVLASLAFWNLRFSLGVLAGCLLAVANFRILARVLRRQFAPGRRLSLSGVLVRYYLRFAATGAIILVLIKFRLVNPIGLLVGLSLIVVNLSLAGFSLARQNRIQEAL